MQEETETSPGSVEHGTKADDTATVQIDGSDKIIPAGNYMVDDLKAALGVPADRDLDLLDKGKLKPINPNQNIHVKDGMQFVSRQRSGGSS